ncbi:polysaccharide biosynthesis/export family protein [Sporolituus thermophilus]|uniref:Polysaccharide export outer membrane protein n=1 Tax=Sporolituus thermophilus DSM 23256 TaxID=1123285 RepID=A0A1G7NC60_9FIRM|nr:polysaccharide biosynthesis/export family protein [Sporolituus thermophilus]SDF71546.1 polysaccharide export outer membrane protein [Sporolituus thermophilus DSM 23256]
MKKLAFLVIIVLLFSILASPFAQAGDYRLGPMDVLNIGVWGYEELQIEQLAIRPDGKIAFPLVGEVQAAGLTPGELADALAQGLSAYVKDPKVTVNVLKFRTTRVYVLGEVPKPGLYELEKQHNLLDAIGAAGGYTKDAAKKKVHIIRKDKPNEVYKVDLVRLLNHGDLTQNYALNEGDVVYLSKNNRIDFAKDILPWISAMYQISEIQNN